MLEETAYTLSARTFHEKAVTWLIEVNRISVCLFENKKTKKERKTYILSVV